jgi:hypothetical protein
MKGQRISRIQRAIVKVDNRGQQYIVYPDGQMRRMSPDGTPLLRVKMAKKERLKLRQEYAGVKNMKPEELVTKIIEIPVVNPAVKPVPYLGGLPVKGSKMDTANA